VRDLVLCGCPDLLDVGVEVGRVEEQLLFRPEVAAYEGDIDAGLGGDLAESGTGEALAEEESSCGGQ
jgi:hypothetical protein